MFHYRNTAKFLLINAAIGLVISMMICGHYDDSTNWLQQFVLDCFLYSFFISAFLSGGINLLIEFSEKQFSWLDMPIRRLVLDLTLVVTYSFMVSFITSAMFSIYVWHIFTIDAVDWDIVLDSTKFPILVALGITFFFTSSSFLSEWRIVAIEAEQMKSERLAGQYQTLKDQLNPHFLFNSLNVLSNLVHEDAEKSSQFIDKLSSIYRYVLEVQDERLVYLDKELKFASSYLELQKIRFGDKLEYNIAVKFGSHLSIPPLSLQLLLENAIKHNIATREAPLKIQICREGNRLIVINNLQMRSITGDISGIGLENIKKRYSFFTDQEVRVSHETEKFSVSIPLIESAK